MRTKVERRYNDDILSDQLNLYGIGYPDAAEAFRKVEESTLSIKADLSIASVLSVISHKGNISQAVLLDGNDELEIRDGNVCLKDALFVNIKDTGNAPKGVGESSLFFCLGGCCKTPLTLDDPDLIAVGDASMKSLVSALKIEHRGKGFFRDAGIAYKCEALAEKNVYLLCRQDNGVKKMYAVFSQTNGMQYLRFEELVDMVCRHARGARILDWGIMQKERFVNFVNGDGTEFKVSWSDTGYISPTFEQAGVKVKTQSMEEMEILIADACKVDIFNGGFVFPYRTRTAIKRTAPKLEFRFAHRANIDWKKTFHIEPEPEPAAEARAHLKTAEPVSLAAVAV